MVEQVAAPDAAAYTRFQDQIASAAVQVTKTLDGIEEHGRRAS
jgi:hypothetical protein